MIIYLGHLLPDASSNLPEGPTGSRIAFCLVLLRMGFALTLPVTGKAVSSYLAISPLPGLSRRFDFCCTFLRVASTGRYPASCPVELGLSSAVKAAIIRETHIDF